MDFRIAHLTGDAHNIAKTTASDVHLNPPDHGMLSTLFRWPKHNFTISRHQN